MPSSRKCGATRAPTTAPTTTPASENAVTTRPRRQPVSAVTATTATMIQSRLVITASSARGSGALPVQGAALVPADRRRRPVRAEIDCLAADLLRTEERHLEEAVVAAGLRHGPAAG